jgi:tetratricopeptide (TPR) repeat protein
LASNPRIEELRRRIERDPASRLFAQLAEELRKEGELHEAVRVSRDGLQRHPNYPSARITLGRALLELGDADAARAELESALKGAPDNILASRYLAEALEATGDLQGALSRYRQTLTLSPGDKAIQARLQALEVRSAAPVGRAAAAATAPGEAAAAAEPPPIQLVDADESFELESPYESPPTVVGAPGGAGSVGWAEAPDVKAARDARRPGEGGSGRAGPGFPAPGGDVPPIAVAAASDAFELEQPWASPPTRIGSVGEPAADGAGDDFFVAEDDAQTLPRRPPAAEPPPGPIAAGEAARPLASPTLAELYFSQGANDRAIDVYREVLRREPENERARARLSELERLDRQLGRDALPAVAAGARREQILKTIARLEDLLHAVQALKRG